MENQTNPYASMQITIGGRELEEPGTDNQNAQSWLAALFATENLNLLVGNGFTRASLSKCEESTSHLKVSMDLPKEDAYPNQVAIHRRLLTAAKALAVAAWKQPAGGTASANLENYIQACSVFIEFYQVNKKEEDAATIEEMQEAEIKTLCENIEAAENHVMQDKSAVKHMRGFLGSFIDRPTNLPRAHVFTTNYDRLIEKVCSRYGIPLIDRFLGTHPPTYFPSTQNLDLVYARMSGAKDVHRMHGVARYTKLHGSLDWAATDRSIIRQEALSSTKNILIYPRASKAIETTFFPYSELFRDFAGAIVQPNSVLVCYGYGFGDSHINHIITSMMSIVSTHLIVIDIARENVKRADVLRTVPPQQLTTIYGEDAGDLAYLSDHLLPKFSHNRHRERANEHARKTDNEDSR